MFYVLYLPEHKLYKIGITSKTLKLRYAGEHVKYKEILTVQFSTGSEAFYVEKLIKQQNKLFRFQGASVLKHGNTEVYTDVYIGNIDTLRCLAAQNLLKLKELNESTTTK